MATSNHRVIGLMSGTSLDGLDIAYCHFSFDNKQWNFNIERTKTVIYPKTLSEKIEKVATMKAKDFLLLHNELGYFFGKKVNEFINQNKLVVDFISSHGHTVFHQPDKHFNFQIGNPSIIRQVTQLPVIADFRTKNILAGGQGAPLVPIGDKLLFHQYNYCINLGGFSNISYDNENNQRIAFDICPVNIVLNLLANKTGKDFDKDGEIGKQGKIAHELLIALNAISYYKQPLPKSLGTEWLTKYFLPVLEKYDLPIADKTRTVYEHIVQQFQNILNRLPNGKILLSGGGTHNKFLLHLLKENIKQEIIIPDKKIVDFKEALIFAFLGVLKKENKPNCLSSYTGAPEDMVCGEWFY